MDVLNDGIKALRSSTAELVDGAPRALSSADLSKDAQKLGEKLQREFPDATVRLRETGRLIRAEVHDTPAPQLCRHPHHYWPGEEERAWRLALGAGQLHPADRREGSGRPRLNHCILPLFRPDIDGGEFRHGPLHAHCQGPSPCAGNAIRSIRQKGSARRRMRLIVMLHGCTQSAADFAAGSRMNRLADELGFLALYPEQSQKANQSRIYIAGISAGGAAAAIIGAAYPDLYIAVGATQALREAISRYSGRPLPPCKAEGGVSAAGRLPCQLPTIVFHGDKNRVVHPSNAAGFLGSLERVGAGPLTSRSTSGRAEGGWYFTQELIKIASARFFWRTGRLT